MTVDLVAADAFMTKNARLLDRRRLALLLGAGSPDLLLDALEGYRNADGGFGSGLEPDLRSTTSQPAGALHAFEVFEELAPATTARATELCDWLESVRMADGGLPFALPIPDADGCAPFWVGADPHASSLHITAAVTAIAQRVARHDADVAAHPWLGRSTRFCLDQIRSKTRCAHVLELRYALQFLDSIADQNPGAADEIKRLGVAIPPTGCVHVEGGVDDEMMRPLDFSPAPGRPVDRLFSAQTMTADVERLAAIQGEDGGWPCDWVSYSPAAALEWRGWLTVRAITILRARGVI